MLITSVCVQTQRVNRKQKTNMCSCIANVG